MPDSNTAAAAGFQNPEAYEKVMGRWSRRLAPLLIRFGGLSDGDRVLDVGCGTGSLTFTVPQIANVASITGIDLTEAYVDFARAHNNDPRINFQQADARALPFEDNSFDRAFSMLVLQFIPDAARAVAEMRQRGKAWRYRHGSGVGWLRWYTARPHDVGYRRRPRSID